jgi:hypothetical protein
MSMMAQSMRVTDDVGRRGRDRNPLGNCFSWRSMTMTLMLAVGKEPIL